MRARIIDSTLRLIDENATHDVLLESARSLQSTLIEASASNSLVRDASAAESILPSGAAISAENAARCVSEYLRTAMFLRGVRSALSELRRRGVSAPRILYAGCGPFATLVLPVLLLPGMQGARVTLLDIHSDCLLSAVRAFDSLGISDCLLAAIECDATRWVPDGQYDLLVTETMSRALSREPQVSIEAHLAPCLKEGGMIVPERITLTASLMDTRMRATTVTGPDGVAVTCLSHQDELTVSLGEVLVLDQSHAQQMTPLVDAMGAGRELVVASAEIELQTAPAATQRAMLLTEIITHGHHRLGLRNCSLTMPHPLREVTQAGRYRFDYICGPKPGMRVARLP